MIAYGDFYTKHYAVIAIKALLLALLFGAFSSLQALVLFNLLAPKNNSFYENYGILSGIIFSNFG